LLGDAGMVELVSLCGYYTLVCFLRRDQLRITA